MDDRPTTPPPAPADQPPGPGQIRVADALKLAKGSCKTCFGRGWAGVNLTTKVRPLCHCVARRIGRKELVP